MHDEIVILDITNKNISDFHSSDSYYEISDAIARQSKSSTIEQHQRQW
jgi:hypothetical protein